LEPIEGGRDRLERREGTALFQPIRVALTGRGHGRELDRLWPLIVKAARILHRTWRPRGSRGAVTLEAMP
jgi:hypothetical protein